MLKILILKIVVKDRSKLYGTSQDVAIAVSPCEESSIEKTIAQYCCIGFFDSEVVRVYSFFLLQKSRAKTSSI